MLLVRYWLAWKNKVTPSVLTGRSVFFIFKHLCQCLICFSCVFVLDPEAVDESLLQFCSSQLKLLQLYTDVQLLHTPDASPTEPEHVRNTDTILLT